MDSQRFEYVSPSIKELIDHPPKEVEANPEIWLSKIHEADRQAVEKMLCETRDDAHEPVEYRIVRDGTQIWVRDKAFLLPAETNHGPRVAGLARM